MAEQEHHVSKDEVRRIASLARIALTEDEQARATKHLSDILGHFASIRDVDTEGVATSDDASGRRNSTRSDEAQPNAWCSSEELLNRAPEVQDSQVQVRAVFEE